MHQQGGVCQKQGATIDSFSRKILQDAQAFEFVKGRQCTVKLLTEVAHGNFLIEQVSRHPHPYTPPVQARSCPPHDYIRFLSLYSCESSCCILALPFRWRRDHGLRPLQLPAQHRTEHTRTQRTVTPRPHLDPEAGVKEQLDPALQGLGPVSRPWVSNLNGSYVQSASLVAFHPQLAWLFSISKLQNRSSARSATAKHMSEPSTN